LYFPASQLVQSAAPANEYVPAPQSKQAAGLVCAVQPEYLPAAQVVQTWLVCSGKPNNLPASQLVQAVAPKLASIFLLHKERKCHQLDPRSLQRN
jgi:hypothetical protein